MHTHQIPRRSRLVVLPVLAIAAAPAAFFLGENENALFLALLLAPALVVFGIHLLCLGLWQRLAVWRLRRRVDAAMNRGDASSLRRAAAETAQAERDWPGRGLHGLSKGLEILRHRVERHPS